MKAFLAKAAGALKAILPGLAVILATLVFLQAASEHASRLFPGGLWAIWGSSNHAGEVFLFLSPCIIFTITTIVYYRFIVNYTGEIAGWSVAGLFAALLCCVKLLEAAPDNWSAHLTWVYVLFSSYVVWDVVMLLCFLPGAKNQVQAQQDRKEIRALSFNINQPTLLAVVVMWAAVRHFLKDGADPSSIGSYVNGIVAFHLVFASGVCIINWAVTKLTETALMAEKLMKSVEAPASGSPQAPSAVQTPPAPQVPSVPEPGSAKENVA